MFNKKRLQYIEDTVGYTLVLAKMICEHLGIENDPKNVVNYTKTGEITYKNKPKQKKTIKRAKK